MKKRNPWMFPMLAVSLALCLPHPAIGQEAAGGSAGRNIDEMKLGPIPGLPTCLSGAVESGDPSKGPSIILAKLKTGCSIPWHWHTAAEYVMVVKGTGRVDMKDAKSKKLEVAGFALFPSRHTHQFRCTKSCTVFLYIDAAFDIHYVNAKGEELTPDDALKAVKEKAAKG